MNTVKYQVVNSEDHVIRLLQLGRVDQQAASDKVRRFYGPNAIFLRVEVISNKMYKILKEMGIKG